MSKSISKTKPVFIAGHRKSGTTMFLNLFDNHPELCVFPVDINVLYAYFPVFEEGKYRNEEKKKRLDLIVFRDMQNNEKITSKLDVELFRKKFFDRMESKSYIIQNILEQLLLAYQDINGNPSKENEQIVAKETSIEIYSASLFQWFPNAKFIQLIRDPRDNFAALKSGIKNHYSNLDDDEKTVLHSLLERCHLGMTMAMINQSRFGKDRYSIVRFEDLLKKPTIKLKKICDFLEISYHDNMSIPTVMGEPTRGNNFDKMNFSKMSDINIGRWKERILPEEAMIIEFHFKELMHQFGYEPAYSENEQADAAAEYYKWSNYKYHYADRFKN